MDVTTKFILIPAPKTQLQCEYGYKIYKSITQKLQDQTWGDGLTIFFQAFKPYTYSFKHNFKYILGGIFTLKEQACVAFR